MSPTVAVFATLALILIVPRKVPMWISFLGACLALPLLGGKGLAGSWDLWTDAVENSWIFTAACAAVFLLSSILTHGGHLRVLCDFAAAAIPSRRVRVALMPALVGLVPMPGGAIVSAPLIDRSLGGADVPATDKNLINYWFRHIWEVSWPLYPAVLLAVGYVKAGDNRFYWAQSTLTVVLATVGFLWLLRGVTPGRGEGARQPLPSVTRARAILPIVALIVIPLLPSPPREILNTGFWHVAGAVIVAILLALLTTTDLFGLNKVPFDKRIYSMTALAFLVKVFGDLVGETTRGEEFFGSVPTWVLIAGLPFTVGFATGATLSFATIAFPLVADVAEVHRVRGVAGGDIVPWLVLAYAGGFLGYLTSPVHMCLVLSTRYFNSKLLSTYARLALPLLAFLAAAVGLFFLLGGRFDA